jgi:uncharacterized phage protein (TIGR01671 family)
MSSLHPVGFENRFKSYKAQPEINLLFEFRGLSKTGKWLYGLPAYDNDNCLCIAHMEQSGWFLNSIQGNTLGLYTGYDDNDGKKIFQGDFVKSFNEQIPIGKIEFNQATFWIRNYDEYWEQEFTEEMWLTIYNFHSGDKKPEMLHWAANRIPLTVIGNIYENPELFNGIQPAPSAQ